MTARKVGRIYHQKQIEIVRCKAEITRLTKLVDSHKQSTFSNKKRMMKQLKFFLSTRNALYKEIEHYQFLIHMIELGIHVVKEYATAKNFNRFYQNNFENKRQLDIALDEDVSEVTIARAVSSLNKVFMNYIRQDLESYLQGDKAYLKMLKAWQQELN